MKLATLFGAPSSPRDKLREAQSELAKARASHTKAQDASARVRELAAAATTAEANRKTAHRAATEAASQYALQGAGGEPPEVQALIDAAVAADSAASRARLLADGATKALGEGRAIPAETEAAEAVRRAEDACWSALGDVIFAEEIAPALAAARKLRTTLDAVLAPLRKALAVARWTPHKFCGWQSEVESALNALCSVEPPEKLNWNGRPMGGEPSGPLVEFAHKLFSDADAKL